MQIARRIAYATLGAIVLSPVSIKGQAGQSGLSVAATVARSCQIDGGSLGFGNYDPVGANANSPLDAETIIVITCTRGTPAAVALNAGGHASGSQRFMMSGASLLNYDLYQDPGRNQHWGDSAGDTLTLGPSSGNPQSIYIYGRVPGNQDVVVGGYNDSVVATVYF